MASELAGMAWALSCLWNWYHVGLVGKWVRCSLLGARPCSSEFGGGLG
jgi:hypothetical protein